MVSLNYRFHLSSAHDRDTAWTSSLEQIRTQNEHLLRAVASGEC
jgi:hypothetical protein